MLGLGLGLGLVRVRVRVTYNCTVHGADLTYVSLLDNFCIIEYVTNKTLNLESLEPFDI